MLSLAQEKSTLGLWILDLSAAASREVSLVLEGSERVMPMLAFTDLESICVAINLIVNLMLCRST